MSDPANVFVRYYVRENEPPGAITVLVTYGEDHIQTTLYLALFRTEEEKTGAIREAVRIAARRLIHRREKAAAVAARLSRRP